MMNEPARLETDAQSTGSTFREGPNISEFTLTFEETLELYTFCAAHRLAPTSIFAEAFSVVVSRLSGNDELVIRVEVHGRKGRPADKRRIKNINTALELQVAVTGSLLSLASNINDGISRQSSECDGRDTFAVLRTTGQHHGSLSRSASSEEGIKGASSTAERDLTGSWSPNTQFEIDFGMDQEQIKACISSKRTVHDAKTINRYLSYLRSVIRAILADPSRTVDDVDMIDAAERKELILLGRGESDLLQNLENYSNDLFELVAGQAKRTPNHIALIEPSNEITYSTLARRAHGIALSLAALQIGPEERVAVLTDRTIDAVIGVLGILAAGATYVPMDPGNPKERLTHVLRDASITTLVTPRALRNIAEGLAGEEEYPIRLLEIDNEVPTATDSIRRIRPHEAAYVIYTSGSTGLPKGVVVEHRQALNLIQGFVATHKFGGQRLLMIPPLFFDASIGDLFSALAVGATIVMHPDPATLDLHELARFCREFHVTAIDAPASLVNRWATECETFSHAHELLPNLELVMFGGEGIAVSQIGAFARMQRGKTTFVNHYGPTEASVCATILATNHGTEFAEETLPIGRPLPGVQLYILDGAMRMVPHGMPGELYIGGRGVARGYLGRPDLTALGFVKNPFAGCADDRLYRTGDLVRWNSNGLLQFLGRIDRQVKIRGVRIELAEIESALRKVPGIQEAIVTARTDESEVKRLIAYLVPEGSADGVAGSVNIGFLRRHLADALPEYMLPSAFVVISNLPLTATGKIDYRALPAPGPSAYITQQYEQPCGAVEHALSQVWAEVLRVERVGRLDNFFELGGSSLLAMSVIERMRKRGFRTTVRDQFASKSLRDLARRVEENSPTAETTANPIPLGTTTGSPAMLSLIGLDNGMFDHIAQGVKGGSANIQDVYPLSPLQTGILFHHRLGTTGDVYVNVRLLRFESRAMLEEYTRVFQTLVDRHDVLRTSFEWDHLPEPMQVVWRSAHVGVTDLSQSRAEAHTVEALLERFRPGKYRMDLHEAPLIKLFAAEDEDHRWLLVELMHHLIADDVSMQQLRRELASLLFDPAATLPDPIPFRNQILILRRAASQYEDELYFHELLGDLEHSTTPFGLVDILGDGERIVEATLSTDDRFTRRIRQAARGEGVSVATICHLAWGMVLSRLIGRDDVVYGTVLSGRMHTDTLENQPLGMFINTLPVRIRFGDLGPKSAVRMMHSTLSDLIDHENAPLSLALECASVPAPAPLFASLLNYRVGNQDAGQAQTNRLGEGIELIAEVQRSNYPVNLNIDDFPDRLILTAQIDKSVNPERICRFMYTAIDSLVTALEKGSAISVLSLEVMPPEERSLTTEQWNTTTAVYDEQLCIHELVEVQARGRPDAVALVCEQRELTYAELNKRANQLARYLLSKGIRPDDRVAICLDRSIELVVALLAILKAGAAYVPLDPSYPAERLRFMLADSDPVALLTQANVRDVFSGTFPGLIIEQDLAVKEKWAHFSELDLPKIELGLTSQNLVYLIYTSGSTGTPKGVMVEHRNLHNHIHWQVQAFSLTSDDVFLQRTAISFDASVWELWTPLAIGARLVLLPAEFQKAPAKIAEVITENHVTVAQFVPSLLQAILRDGDFRCRYIFCGGEPLTATLLPRAQPHASEGVINLYGPTETTIDATYWHNRGSVLPHVVPIGRPIANTRVYILDTLLRPAPIDTIGEIFIGGAGVSRGYLNRPELTDERFVVDPFASRQQARMYRTGDLGAWRPDGNIEFCGRNDDQIKIRGFRIEIGEIESQLKLCPGVGDVVTVARDMESEGRQLAAYYTLARNEGGEDQALARLDPDYLRTFLADRLPEYMVPTTFMKLDSLPLTSNGKIDKKALPEPERDSYAIRGYEMPRQGVEEIQAAIWADILRVDHIGRNDDFFALGGDSLLSLQVISRLRKENLTLTPKQIFQYRTIAQLSGVLEPVKAESVGAPDDEASGLFEPTPMMNWLQEIGFPTDEYNTTILIRTPKGLRSETVVTALQQLVDHHDTLRMELKIDEASDWFPTVRPPNSLAVAPYLTKIDGLPLGRDAGIKIFRQQVAERRKRIRPCEGELAQFVWLDMGDGDTGLLALTISHLAMDGVSWQILLSDLRSACEARATGKRATFGLKGTSYRRWSQLASTAARDARRIEEIGFWRAVLAPGGALIDGLRLSGDTTDHAGRTTLVLPAQDTQRLFRAISTNYHVALTDLLITALAIALVEWKEERGDRQEALLIDLNSHGREEIADGMDLTHTLGWFTSLYPVRLDLPDAPRIHLHESLRSVARQLREAPDNGIGYVLLRYLNQQTKAVMKALGKPQVGFNFLGNIGGQTDQDWAVIDPNSAIPDYASHGWDTDPAVATPFPLEHLLWTTVGVREDQDGPTLQATVGWADKRLPATDAVRIVQNWFALLPRFLD